MTTTTIPDVPVPPGARPDTWQDDSPLPYRVLLGEVRGIDGVNTDHVSVQTTAIQFSDGRLDDGSVHDPPHVYLGDDALTTARACCDAYRGCRRDRRVGGQMSTSTHSPDVPVPAGAVEVYDWADDNEPPWVLTDQTNPNANRYFTGSSWTVDRAGREMRVFIDGLQHANGRVERNIVIDGDAFTIAEARQLAAALIAAADEVDQNSDDRTELARCDNCGRYGWGTPPIAAPSRQRARRGRQSDDDSNQPPCKSTRIRPDVGTRLDPFGSALVGPPENDLPT
jgi:hypothetical protein